MPQTDPIDFIDQFDTLSIASITKDLKPHNSYAPFVSKESRYYICISKMAKHTNNLLKTPNASIMFIQDEVESKNSFARNRVTFDVDVSNIKRDTEIFSEIMELFSDKFGEKASMYEQMADFYLFELTPLSGRAVFGFGEAYRYKDGEFKPLMDR